MNYGETSGVELNGSELSIQIVPFALGSFIGITITQEYLEPKLANGCVHESP